MIGRCLEVLLKDSLPGEFEVVVVVNGSTDATAELARAAAPQAMVVRIDVASKIAALRYGDAVTRAFPRVYLDADVTLDTAGLRTLVDALAPGLPRAASPAMVVDTSASTAFTKAYFRVWEMTDYRRDAMVGSGVYAVTEEGHRRIADWPALIADDLFVQESFARDERVIVGAEFSVRAPTTLRAQVGRMIRWRRGNVEFARFRAQHPERFPAGTDEAGSSVRNLIRRVARTPRRWPDFVVYVAVYLAAGIVARRDARAHPGLWRRDESSRSDDRSG